MGKPTSDRKPFTAALVEAARLHTQAAMRAEGATASLAERVSSSKPGSSHLSFYADLPLSVEMEQSLLRWVQAWEQKVEGQTSDARRAQTEAILGERGDPTAVAFVFGSTTEAVRKLRGRNGRDPDTGQRKGALRQERVDGKPTAQVPLTAPPGTVAAGLEALAAEEATDSVGTQ
ncbi:MAG TPA: hypothetical protein VHR18_13465 [Solirubrobacterales bacterium]|nr:hypothetical protein [Solirubrobacterales bacterium]